MGTGYSINGLHVEFHWLDSSSQLVSFFVTTENACGAFLIEMLVSLLTEVALHLSYRLKRLSSPVGCLASLIVNVGGVLFSFIFFLHMRFLCFAWIPSIAALIGSGFRAVI